MVQIEQLLVSNMFVCFAFQKVLGIQFPNSMYCTVSSQEPQYNFIRAVHNKD